MGTPVVTRCTHAGVSMVLSLWQGADMSSQSSQCQQHNNHHYPRHPHHYLLSLLTLLTTAIATDKLEQNNKWVLCCVWWEVLLTILGPGGLANLNSLHHHQPGSWQSSREFYPNPEQWLEPARDGISRDHFVLAANESIDTKDCVMLPGVLFRVSQRTKVTGSTFCKTLCGLKCHGSSSLIVKVLTPQPSALLLVSPFDCIAGSLLLRITTNCVIMVRLGHKLSKNGNYPGLIRSCLHEWCLILFNDSKHILTQTKTAKEGFNSTNVRKMLRRTI